MFLKKKKTKNEIYWSLAENYREGKKVKQKIIMTLGKTENALKILKENPQYKKYYDEVYKTQEVNAENSDNIETSKSSSEGKTNLFNKYSFKYMKLKKNKVVEDQLKLPYKSIETIIEMGMDYVNILKNINQSNLGYKKALYDTKIEEISEITSYLIETIGYSKKCKKKNNKNDEVGYDGFEAIMKLHR